MSAVDPAFSPAINTGVSEGTHRVPNAGINVGMSRNLIHHWCLFVLLLTVIISLIMPRPSLAANDLIDLNPHTSALMITIEAGTFIMGSTALEREQAYQLDEQHNSHASRRYQWFENETYHKQTLPRFAIDQNLVTNADYQHFVDSGHRAPFINKRDWKKQGLIHPYQTVKRFLWKQGHYPKGRGEHPVVLVSQTDARAYCHWRGQLIGPDQKGNQQPTRHLPLETEWEKAARGSVGQTYPWGDDFDAKRLNSNDLGPYDTSPVSQHTGSDANNGGSPYGIYHMAGMVFEWTASACPDQPNQTLVKGGSWDDYPGVTRPAARHCRPNDLRHVLVGFRCAAAQ